MASAEENENDMRFVYCACAISFMINDWSGEILKALFQVENSKVYLASMGIGLSCFRVLHSTVDRILASLPAAKGLNSIIPNFFSEEILKFLRLID